MLYRLILPVSPFYIIIGYIVGMVCSTHIFADVPLTHWTNIWVYFWLFLWPLGLLYFFVFYAVVAVVILLIVLWLIGRLLHTGPFA